MTDNLRNPTSIPEPDIILPMKPAPPKKPFPWLALILFLVSLVVFWILPFQLGKRPVQVDFAPASKK